MIILCEFHVGLSFEPTAQFILLFEVLLLALENGSKLGYLGLIYTCTSFLPSYGSLHVVILRPLNEERMERSPLLYLRVVRDCILMHINA